MLRSVPAPALTSAPWGSTPRGSAAPSSVSPRRGPGRCHATSNQRELSDRAAAAIEEAGGVPLPFNTIAVSDNQSQGTPGMRASLISREVIADSIELMVHAHDFDAVRLPRRVRQDRPGRADGARARRQAGGRPLQRADAGRAAWPAPTSTIQHVWEAVGAFERGAATRERAGRAGAGRLPRPGTCAGHFTANTMAVALDCLGVAARWRRADPRGRDRGEGGGGGARGPPGRGARSRRADRARVPGSPRAAQRDGGHRGHRRLRPTACCTCSRSPTRPESR